MSQPFGRVLVGRTLAGRYELREVIGSGGMSVVFLGHDRTLGRPVAVKVVSVPTDSEELRENMRERFRREAASAARIPHHANVVQIYDYGTDPELDLDFIVMELLRGRDLKQTLAAEPPPPLEEALRILREAARGLAAGHRVGIVHRDVKPANVFLVGDGVLESVRLLDFGIAKPMEGDDSHTITTLGQLPHSPAYASPEQLEEGAMTPASDVYQLGLIGYELLTGERPFSEAERARIRAGEEVPLVAPPRWSAVPAPVREVVARALRRDPAERYPDAGAFADALARAGDATLLHPAVAVDPDPTATLPAAVPLPPPPVTPAPGTSGPEMPRTASPPLPPPPVPTGAPRPARRVPAVRWAVPLFLLAAIALWAATRGRGDAAAGADPLAPDSTQLASLEEEFTRLQGTASVALEDTATAPVPAPEAAAPVPDAEPEDGDESVLEREGREREEAMAVQAAVLDANRAWVDGDLDRHMSHYGRRVDYYDEENASHSFVRRDRRINMEIYPRRTMTVKRQAITFRPDGRVRDLVDKTWEFANDRERWIGSMRQELILEKRDGRWVIVSEKSADVDYSRKERI